MHVTCDIARFFVAESHTIGGGVSCSSLATYASTKAPVLYPSLPSETCSSSSSSSSAGVPATLLSTVVNVADMGSTPARSLTGQHTLLPASDATREIIVPLVPSRSFFGWTFGRRTAIWRIWPAVLMHTGFAAVVVSVSMKTRYELGIPNVLLTLLGVVIGFVISYRAMSGYDRYWQGRSLWSDVMRTSRTFSRFVWFHVPLRVTNDTGTKQGTEESGEAAKKAGKEKRRQVRRVMSEKKMALDLIEAFSVALKHHLRGEKGIYYEDLYMLVRPLHDHAQHPEAETASPDHTDPTPLPKVTYMSQPNPIIPPINSYGATSSRPLPGRQYSSASSSSSISDASSESDEHRHLLPGIIAPMRRNLFSNVSKDLIPFNGILYEITGCFKWRNRGPIQDLEQGDEDDTTNERNYIMHAKHRPRIAGGGENIPLDIVRSLSGWLSVLEERGCVPGTTLGAMFGCLAAFEDSLANLEKILTTPLPFMFSVHIRHTVWLYLFALPFQLVDIFKWYAIPGVMIASFIYLGFVAAGEEIEQPFGYDANDLDLDLFCRDVVRADIEHLKKTPCRNVVLDLRHVTTDAVVHRTEDERLGLFGSVEEVFGKCTR